MFPRDKIDHWRIPDGGDRVINYNARIEQEHPHTQ